MHKHRCGCGFVWEHENRCVSATEEEFNQAHTCPKCGEMVTYKYRGQRPGEFRSCFHGQPPVDRPPEMENFALLVERLIGTLQTEARQ